MADIKSGIERRVTLRLLSYWEKLRAGRAMPSEQDIDPEDLPDLWDSCFLLHVADINKPDYNYTYLGSAIADAYQHGLVHGTNSGIVSPNAKDLGASLSKVVSTCKPLMEEGEFLNLHQDVVKFRQCLLPLGTDGNIEAIFGGMTFKIFQSR